MRSGPDSMQLVYIYCCPSYVIRPPMWLCDSVYYPALPIYALISRFKEVWVFGVGLYWLRALLALLAYLACERLCGLMA